MTQTTYQNIVRAPSGLSPTSRTPITWEALREFARAVLSVDEYRRPLNTAQTQAIGRLDGELRIMQHAGDITEFTIGNFEEDQIAVCLILPDAQYRRDHMLALHARIDDILEGLDLHAAVEMDTDLDCGESP